MKVFVKDERSPTSDRQSLDERLNSSPEVAQRFHRIVDMMEEALAEGADAHQAEERAIEQLDQLGNELLTDWARQRAQSCADQARQDDPQLSKDAKKNFAGTPPTEPSR